MKMAENPYIKQFPDLLDGRTVLYVHGFASSGQSGTVRRLREVFPNATVIAPDLPIHPAEALQLLRQTCETERPDLIIGTSMGGMFTEKLHGFDRICVNPAMLMAETMKEHNMMGTQSFQNPRKDGVQEFYVDKALVKEYKAVTEQNFEAVDADEQHRVWGLFGDEDTTVNTYGLFSAHYPQSAHFHGEHRMNDRSFMHSVLPVIRWIDDRQQQRQRPVVYIGMETLCSHPLQGQQEPAPAASAVKAVRFLIERYQVFFVVPSPRGEAVDAASWLAEHVGIPAWRHTILTDRRDLLYGDYLVEAPTPWDKANGETPLATRIEYGSDTFKTWDDVMEYFARLDGQ